MFPATAKKLGRRFVTALAVTLCGAYALACATAPAPPVVRPHIPAEESSYLLDPLAGYPLAVAPEQEEILRRGFAVLRHGGDLEATRLAVLGLLEDDPGLHPAAVLAAQVAYLSGAFEEARERLEPVTAELPDYLSCQMLRGRTAERLDDPAAAFVAFHQVRQSSSVARERAAALLPAALELEVGEIRGKIGQGHVEEAERRLDVVRGWIEDTGGEPTVDVRLTLLDVERALAVATGDVEAEIDVVRRWVELDPTDDETLERLAELEIALGDVRAGLEKLAILAERRPDDQALLEKVERAKFLRRLELLPSFVQELAAAAELDRADFATLLYWLVPGVRYAEVSDPPIATDILDHPRREEIVRVMNLDLIEVDETLHRFSPDEPATRALAFRAFLGLLRLSDTEFACLDATEAELLTGRRGAASRLVCRKAAQCGLIPEEADCLPAAALSGPEALDLFRRVLDLLESR